MSRIGKKPVPLPKGVTAQLRHGTVSVKGPRASSNSRSCPKSKLPLATTAITVTPREADGSRRAPCGACSARW